MYYNRDMFFLLLECGKVYVLLVNFINLCFSIKLSEMYLKC